MPDEKVFLAVIIVITDIGPGIVVGLNVYAVRLDASSIGQITGWSPLEKCEIAVSFASKEIKIAIFIPIANCDCRTLTSAITQHDSRSVSLEIFEAAERRIVMCAGIRIEADSSAVKLTQQQVLFAISVPVNNKW